MHSVRLFFFQHLLVIFVSARDAVCIRRLLRVFPRADGADLHVADAPERLDMRPANKPDSNDART